MKFDKQLFKDIEAEIAETNLKLSALKNARTTLKALCEHDWVAHGHDSHYAWEICTVCGETRTK